MKNEKGAACAAPPLSDLEAFGIANHHDAARTLIDRETLASSAFRTRSVKSRAFVHPRIWRFHLRFRDECWKRGIPILPFELWRSDARQERLKAAGASKAGAGQSPHNFGCAVDFVHGSRFWDLDRAEWDLLGAIGKEIARKQAIKITWGGDWRFYDPAHWELTDWKAQNAKRGALGLDLNWPELDKAGRMVTDAT